MESTPTPFAVLAVDEAHLGPRRLEDSVALPKARLPRQVTATPPEVASLRARCPWLKIGERFGEAVAELLA